MKLKVCGLFRDCDIDYVNSAKPDFVGFVFAKSKRQIDIETAARFKQKLDPKIKVVGVFVDSPAKEVIHIANSQLVDILQFHGNENDEYVKVLRKYVDNPIIKAVSVNNEQDILESLSFNCDYLLFDNGKGGTGESFDWGLLKNINITKPYFLAGGINEQNIHNAMKCKPFAIDVSSGVETLGVKDFTKIKNIRRIIMKDSTSRYGIHGGQYIPETLMNEVKEFEKQYEFYKNDPQFQEELNILLADYAGRPSLLYYAEKMSKDLGGAKIYLKREDLNHTGSHKINNVLGQALLAKKMGKTRIIAETGAGQHGVATATAAALLDLECEIYMGKEDTERQALNVFRMELLGAKVHPVTSGTMTLKDAVNETMREWVTRIEDTHYVLGSVVGPHPFPMIVRDFQAIISKEAREQILEKEGKLPTAVLACVGGGSNAIGMFAHFIDDKDVALIGCEAAGLGVDTDKHAATITKGSVGIFHGMKTYFCQDDYGQIAPVHSISAGLDYPGIGPEHSNLHDTKRASYVPVTDQEAVDAFTYIAKTEGIIAAIESSHAIAHAIKIAPTMKKDDIILISLSGRGDKDVSSIAKFKGVDINE